MLLGQYILATQEFDRRTLSYVNFTCKIQRGREGEGGNWGQAPGGGGSPG